MMRAANGELKNACGKQRRAEEGEEAVLTREKVVAVKGRWTEEMSAYLDALIEGGYGGGVGGECGIGVKIAELEGGPRTGHIITTKPLWPCCYSPGLR